MSELAEGIRFGVHSAQERKPRLVDSAYSAIKSAIRNGTFPPGFQGSELEIAQRLGMSRTPVHQAIVQLQSEGMLELRAKRGVIVTALSPDDMREVYDVIVAVEGMAAHIIATLPADERDTICDRLEGLNDRMRQALDEDDLDRWADEDGAFHSMLVERAGNGRLERIAAVNLDQSHRARQVTLNLRPKPVQSLIEHKGIIDAMRSGDAPNSRLAAQQHKERARDIVVPLLRRYKMNHL
ncbi:GntR family transcriptional regulator [Fulvimarina sp. MAC8]|uniref:GntR family transcriptional regulator n=1 Tax=Fulvimarina sp. MAC8 TaxID=3162874 RepID=UPI0032EDE58D